MKEWQQRLLSSAADIIYTAIPRRRPDAGCLDGARLIAHRGNTGGDGAAMENTLAAFDNCLALGLFGIELDVQWTADGEPVVIHDPDTARLFKGPPVAIAETRFDDLRTRHPEIPSLEDVVERFGGGLHLMIELKTDTFELRHLATLRRRLQGLDAETDYHLLCLVPDVLDALDGIAPGARMVVAETNTREIVAAMGRLRLTRMAGHYLLVDRAMRSAFDRQGVEYGVGMVPGESVLRRELNLGSRWIFTNRGEHLARALRELQRRHPA